MKSPTSGLFPAMLDSHPTTTFSKAKLSFSWPPSLPLGHVVPHRLRRKLRSKFRSGQSPASSLSQLQSSWDPADTLKALRSHHWSYYDAQYLLIAVVGLFCFSVIENPGPLPKSLIATLLISSLIVPITRQFFLPLLPVVTYLVLFCAARYIPADWKPPIWVRVLPALENIIYGANLSNILSAHTNAVLDVIAWIPYGILHFSAPFMVAIAVFIFGPPGTLPVYSRTFGYMNALGVAMQLVFPCAPPWYENMNGLAPANYSMQGSPAGLARIDKLFGVDMYTSAFTASPIVFGAFPSLHASGATLNAMFLSHVFPRARPIFIGWIFWIWWATLYLSHHYAVDLIGGSILASIFFYVAKSKFLPRLQLDKDLRWDYDFTEIGDNRADYTYILTDIDTTNYHSYNTDSDEWTVGTSSSISSGSISPIDESQSSWEREMYGDRDPESLDLRDNRR